MNIMDLVYISISEHWCGSVSSLLDEGVVVYELD